MSVTPVSRDTNPIELAWDIWRRRHWLAVLVFVLTAAAAASVVAFLPNIYQSTATVLVDRQQVPEEFVRSTVTSALETRLHTISQEILSRSRLEELIGRFGLYPELRQTAPSEELIQRMRRDIRLDLKSAEARGGRATIAFTLSYQGRDPQTVAQVANTLVSFYIEENLKVRERQATGTAEFLKVQLNEVKARLDTQERGVSEFKKRYVGELPQELEVNLSTLERLNAQLRLNTDTQTRSLERRQILARQHGDMVAALEAAAKAAELARADAEAAARAQGASVPVASARGPVSGPPPDPALLRLAALQQELATLRTRFNDRYPDVVRVKAEIAAAERELAERQAAVAAARQVEPTEPAPAEKPAPAVATPAARPAAPKPVDPQLLRMAQAIDEVDGELKILRLEETRLREAIAGYQRRVQETPLREQQYRELARDYESTKELYGSLLKRYAESQIAESMEQRQKGEQFRLLEPALPGQKPLAPNRPRLALMGLVLALGLAVGAVLLAEQRDTSFHRTDDLRAATPVPVLVSIPRIVIPADRRWARFRAALLVTGAIVAIVVIVGTSYVAIRGNEQLVRLLAVGL